MPGARAAEVDAAARASLASSGFGGGYEHLTHRLGHGIGLDGHERPYLVAGDPTVIEPGMAFSIEPGIYLPGQWGMRIEDIVVATPDGVERLNTTSRSLRVVS